MAVVRCPACRGASRVEPDALGYRVECPRCGARFRAREEGAPRTDSPPPPAPPKERPAAVIPIAPPRSRLAALAALAPDPPPTSAESSSAAPAVPDPEHDPHHPHRAGLPLSVMIGLALIPFGIPLLWIVMPFLTGEQPALSLAVPIALAFSASALCLGVVYTIDWTAGTRVKGVLMLVGLAYLSAAGLYFLKKDLVERVQRLGGDRNEWRWVGLDRNKCQVRLPRQVSVREQTPQPLDGLARMTESLDAALALPDDGPEYKYQVAVGEPLPAAGKPDDWWFDRVGQKLAAGGAPGLAAALKYQDRADAPGRQWTFDPGNNAPVRIVRVYVIKGRVYYLSAEGPHLTPEDEEYGKQFFKSLSVNIK